MTLIKVLLLVLLTIAALGAVEGAPKKPPPKKKSPPPKKKSPPPKKKSPPPKKKSPPPRPPPPSPPPPAPDCTKNGTGFFKNYTADKSSFSCDPIPISCSFGGFNNVETGLCICPLDANGNPLTSGPADGCGTCQPNLDQRTSCLTYVDLCNAYNITSYNTTVRNTVYNTYINQTSASYCANVEPKGQLVCDTSFTVPTQVNCVCPDGSTLKNGQCVDVNECDGQSNLYKYPVDPCYFVPTSLTYEVVTDQQAYNNTTGEPLFNETTGEPIYQVTDYQVQPAYGATCVNYIWSKAAPNTYNCTCPPCYYPSTVDDNGVVQTCDPFPSCVLTRVVRFSTLYKTLVNGTALLAPKYELSDTPLNATTADA